MPKSQEKEIIKGRKYKRISTGEIWKVTGIYEKDNEVWLVHGIQYSIIRIDEFWFEFKEVTL